MILHYLTEDALIALKENVENNLIEYKNATNDWIYSYLGVKKENNHNVFREFKLRVDDFELRLPSDDERELSYIDLDNTITLFKAMMNLTEEQASDERLWAGLCHGDFWSFMNGRLAKNTGGKYPVNNILSHYFLFGIDGARRALFTNTLSRYWWIGKLTMDSKRKDPFELTKYWASDFSTKTLILFSNNYMSNPNIVRGLISALLELGKEKGHGLNEHDLYYKASRYLNVLGATRILDYYSEEEIRYKVLNYIRSMV